AFCWRGVRCNNFSADTAASCCTWVKVHCLGDLSGRQRRNFVPCRKRPPVKWSYWTSAASFGVSGCQSVLRPVDQGLGPPGAAPVKPGDLISGSSIRLSCLRCAELNDEQNPT